MKGYFLRGKEKKTPTKCVPNSLMILSISFVTSRPFGSIAIPGEGAVHDQNLQHGEAAALQADPRE